MQINKTMLAQTWRPIH